MAQDQGTAERLRRVLAFDPRVGAGTLIVKVVDGKVKLSGNAKTPEAANLAVGSRSASLASGTWSAR